MSALVPAPFLKHIALRVRAHQRPSRSAGRGVLAVSAGRAPLACGGAVRRAKRRPRRGWDGNGRGGELRGGRRGGCTRHAAQGALDGT
jgi:hypothetical protein